MDIPGLRTLLLDLNCMTAFRHVMDNPAIASLIALCVSCVDGSDEEHLTEAYARCYNAWLELASKGRGSFAEEALESVLFTESAAARMCAQTEALPYSVMSGMAHDLETLQRLTSIEPAMFLLLCERAGLPGSAAVRLPVWEPVLRERYRDERLSPEMLSREGAGEVARFFKTHGTGLFARHMAVTYTGEGETGLRGIREPDPICFEEMVGYERQREALLDNTRRLLSGHRAGNVLLYGDKGTGKSASVKALLREFFAQGLRMVEVTPQHLTHLPALFALLRKQPCRFIVFVDDLAFNDSCPEYTALKTVLEGGLEARPRNVAVYATSNRRNIVRQSFSEREDDVSVRDTLEEKFSLSDRFDLRLTFSEPTLPEYFETCRALLEMRGLTVEQEVLEARARAFAQSHGGRSPRVARQLCDMLEGELAEKAAREAELARQEEAQQAQSEEGETP